MKVLFKVLIIFCLASSAFAGFGRGGSSGGRSYSSSSYSRSYSPPPRSYYSAPRQTTVYHNTTVHSSSGGSGIHPLVAGMAGYMMGSAMSSNNGGYAAPAPAPQVVYVNGQPQAQPVAVAPQQYDSPQYIQQPVIAGHGFFFYFFLIMILLGGFAFILHKVNEHE